MNGRGKSDGFVSPVKVPNKDREPLLQSAEGVEGKDPAKGNPRQHAMPRTQNRIPGMLPVLERIRQIAAADKTVRFTSLMHHIYDVERLRAAYKALEKKAAAGVDGVTWQEYGRALESNLQDLSARLKRGGYRASPVRRVFVPKPDGRQRPLGVPVLEDKIVQRATVEVLNAIYEADFLGFSYGFRPRRSQHQSLDALYRALMTRKVSWVLDADIRGFFDAIDHEWMMKFIEHRIADPRLQRLIKKWLRAGVLEDEEWKESLEGTPQGGSISPLLANIYLHYVFDLWIQKWRKKNTQQDVVVVRYADDFVVGFQSKHDADRFLLELRERFAKFHLELADNKTRLIEFGRFAASNRKSRGQRRPETFNFLGFTHACDTNRAGKFIVLRQTRRDRMSARLRAIREELRRRLHAPVPETGQWLQEVMRGYFQYHGISRNMPALKSFRHAVEWLWQKALNRRSQTAYVPWPRLKRLFNRWLPKVRVYHRPPALAR